MKHTLDNIDNTGINVRISGKEDYERLKREIEKRGGAATAWDEEAFQECGGESVHIYRGLAKKLWLWTLSQSDVQTTFHIDDLLPLNKKKKNMQKAINAYKKLTRSKEEKIEIKAGLRHEDGTLNHTELCPFLIEYLYENDEQFKQHVQDAAQAIVEDEE